jgi:hypothetical protein
VSDYFDIDSAARSAGLNAADIQRLRELMHREFPDDPMMQDLHVLRACMAIAAGQLTLSEALQPKSEAAA